MSKEAYKTDLQRRLAHLGSRIEEARRHLERGDARAKVEAAGELAELEARRERVRQKLQRLEREPAGGWHAFSTAMAEELEDIVAGIEGWFDRH